MGHIHVYIYIHILPCLGGFIWCLTINPWAHRFLVDIAAAKRHLAMVERCAIPSTSRRSIGRVGTALSGRSQCTGKLGIGHQNWCINDYVTTYSNYIYILYAHRFTKIAKIHWDSIKASTGLRLGVLLQLTDELRTRALEKSHRVFADPNVRWKQEFLYIAHKDTHLYSIHLFCKYLYLHIQDTHIYPSLFKYFGNSSLLHTSQNVLD